ncbi:type IV pilus secretin PilQ [Desulfobotulus sp. H1]|uniref:Type IV pilus secretin PilQ n=1 Tax=Desulfobotulus pelophilus TaxID=2823377 RepID=A0ABT3NBA2_9BACT|nr:type IV pilus secretin family protein [Desulfobotulus pelophilus]MCW7754747.1 type IV pilus secretin PilQ [Desulfobotulus pelophilus]
MAGILVAGLLAACTPSSGTQEIKDSERDVDVNRIERIYLEREGETTSLVVLAKEHLAYTAVKEQDPAGLRLYFPDTILTSDALPEKRSGGAVLSFSADTISETETRLVLVLREDLPYEVKPEGEAGIRILLAGLGEKEKKSSGWDIQGKNSSDGVLLSSESREKKAGQRPELVDVRAHVVETGVRLEILASDTLKDVHAFTVENPPRIVLDIAGLSSPFKGEQRLGVDSSWVRSVRHYGYADKVRVVLDTPEESLHAYEARSVPGGYEVFVASSRSAAGEKKREVQRGSAVIKDIGFTALPEGRSQIFIETDRPVIHEVISESQTRLRLSLDNTRLPEHHERPLVTTRFESALDQVVPKSGPGNKTTFVMDMREPVAYVLNPSGNRIELRFEASSIGPRPIEGSFEAKGSSGDTGRPIATGSFVVAASSEVMKEEKKVSPSPARDSRQSGSASSGKVFTGTPISIDFYETDIRNVFRILQHVSGQNFAIDSDVAGRVTMSLEHPVPWDQILDLVLRMNGLGMVEEGSIIRVAAMTTLRREEGLRQEVLRARQENERRESDLAPLMTEYILINYSNVSSEVIPHVQNILTERGRVSADARNNQLIITDTAEAIANAKTIISRIDKITPQVVIEARIVEASDEFARALGAEWQASTGGSDRNPYATVPSGTLGGQYGYNVSLNTPTGAGNIGLHFARIAGTQLALNARLNLSEQRGETKIVSSPRIVTLDNKTATINQGYEYPYTTRNSDGDVVTEFKNVDLKLEVTPHVTADNRVAMRVNIDKNDIYVMTDDGPALQTKKVETELLVNDGDTIVIGGVVQTRSSHSNNRIPFFHRIPLIGWLFESVNRTENKSELLIFLTPRIVQLENTREL